MIREIPFTAQTNECSNTLMGFVLSFFWIGMP
uniref:Uncharacterized protein n=1 Tax=Arundo donax TaxID=35708 RepID=A0A0A9CI66_ARUDO